MRHFQRAGFVSPGLRPTLARRWRASLLLVALVACAPGATVRFLADFIGSNRAPISEEVVIWPGDTVELIIPSS